MAWPLHLSEVVPWPENFLYADADWDVRIKSTPTLRFSSHALEPGNAVLFSGSSQWHFREPHPGTGRGHFCDLVFFHFVPAGTRELVEPSNWVDIFSAPGLATTE